MRVLGKTRFDAAIATVARQQETKLAYTSANVKRRFARHQQATKAVLELTGVVPPGFDFSQGGQQLGIEIGGVYDPVQRRILVPSQTVGAATSQAQAALAHELTHGLDDEHFGLDVSRLVGGSDEASGAFRALVEGDASYVQLLYARRYGGSSLSPRQSIQAQALGVSAPLTPPLTQELLFPYVQGADFVASLHRRGGWSLVDRAWGDPPISSQQILHPNDYLAGVRPLHVSMPGAGEFGPSWYAVGGGSIGEEDTRVVLGVGLKATAAARVASGWGGGRFEVWKRHGSAFCEGACRGDSVAVLGWRWRKSESSRLFAGAMRDYAELGLLAKPVGTLTWRVDDGYLAALSVRRGSAMAFAPDRELAQRLAAQEALAQPVSYSTGARNGSRLDGPWTRTHRPMSRLS